MNALGNIARIYGMAKLRAGREKKRPRLLGPASYVNPYLAYKYDFFTSLSFGIAGYLLSSSDHPRQRAKQYGVYLGGLGHGDWRETGV